MTVVYITYLALAERWEVAVRVPSQIGDMESAGEGAEFSRLEVARDPNGVIREMVLDARTWTNEELQLLEDTFGLSVRSAVEHLLPDSDLEMSVHVPDSTDLDLAGTRFMAVAGEPGIPTPIVVAGADGAPGSTPLIFEVPEAFDPLAVDLVAAEQLNSSAVEIHLHNGEMRILLPGGATGRDLWVRISAAASGTLLHIAPVRTGSGPEDNQAEAQMTWGLGADLSRVHLRITEDPTVPIGDQNERRTLWAERLLSEAGERRRSLGIRLRDRRRAAREAARVAEILGDETLRSRADAQITRLQRWRFGRIAVLAGLGLIAVSMAVLTAAFLIGAAIGDDGPTDISGGAVGPVVFSFEDRTTVRAAILGGVPVYRAGDDMSLTASLSTVIPMGFGPPDTTSTNDLATQLARSACIEAQNLSAAGNNYNYPGRNMIVRLTRLPDRVPDQASMTDGSLSVIASVLELRVRWNTFSSIIETCTAPGFGPGNRFIGQVQVNSFPETYAVQLPANLPPGLWEVQLVLEAELVDTSGDLRLRVLG